MELSLLLDDYGIIVISVPNMIGISYLVQRLLTRYLGTEKDGYLSKKDLFNVFFLKDTSALEDRFCVGHLGFNHEKMENYFSDDFLILKKKNLISQIVYVIRK
jgi:hypothetical protein